MFGLKPSFARSKVSFQPCMMRALSTGSGDSDRDMLSAAWLDGWAVQDFFYPAQYFENISTMKRKAKSN